MSDKISYQKIKIKRVGNNGENTNLTQSYSILLLIK